MNIFQIIVIHSKTARPIRLSPRSRLNIAIVAFYVYTFAIGWGWTDVVRALLLGENSTLIRVAIAALVVLTALSVPVYIRTRRLQDRVNS